MESSKQFFCHTCKVTFQKVLASEDEEVLCPTCGECFVEMIEDPAHLQQLNTIYHEEHKQSSQQAARGGQEWMTNLTGNIDEIMRNHGETRTVNANGQDINVTTVHRNQGNTSISIANIDNLTNFAHIDIVHDHQGELFTEDDHDGSPEVPELEQVINLEIQIDQQNLNNPPLNNNMPQHQQQQQQQPAGGQQPNDPYNIQNILNGLFGGAPPQGVQVITQVINNGIPQVQNIFGNMNMPQQNFAQAPPAGGMPNLFNLFGGNINAANLFGGVNLENNILTQVLEQSIQSAMNQQHGIPTSKNFIQSMKPIKGSQLVGKEDCQVCFDPFQDEDLLYKLPCKHMFHEQCIMPWLEKHNTCPSCRTELPTDDINYENRKRQTPNDPVGQFLNNNNGDNNNNGGGGSNFNSSYHA